MHAVDSLNTTPRLIVLLDMSTMLGGASEVAGQ